MRHVAHLDGWRGLAIAFVLAEHFIGHWGWIGRLGVDLFFVLSGLLMSRILFEDRTPLPTFYRRRISRILPVFLLFLIVTLSVSAAVGLRVTAADVFATPVFLRSYVDPFIWRSELPIGHLWSLNVEEHSYMLLAAIAAVPLMMKRAGWILVALGLSTFVVIALYRELHPSPTQDWAIRTECAATFLLLSAGYRQVRLKSVPPWLPLVALVIGVSCYVQGMPAAAKVLIAPFALAFAVNHIGETYSTVINALSWRPLCMLGVWSYSVYLWQQPFYEFKHLMPAGLPIVLAFAVALVSFYLFERPSREWLNANWR